MDRKQFEKGKAFAGEKRLGKVILGFKQGCNKEYRRLCGESVGHIAVSQQYTRQPKGSKPAARHTGHEAGLLFERGYNDSILLREGQLAAMKVYLITRAVCEQLNGLAWDIAQKQS